MLIGLIGMIVIMQVYATSEERKRTTTGTSDAQINGSIAMFTLESAIRGRRVRHGHLELQHAWLQHARPTTARRTLTSPSKMAPVAITVGASGAPDTITVIYGSSATAVDRHHVREPAAAGADVSGQECGGLHGRRSRRGAGSAANCSLAEITGFAVGSVNNIEHAVAAAYSYVGTNDNTESPSTYLDAQPVGRPGHVYSTAAMLFSLGRNPVVKRYRSIRRTNKLMTQSLIPVHGGAGLRRRRLVRNEVAEGIVQLKAEYGKDTNADNIVDAWNTTTPDHRPAMACRCLQYASRSWRAARKFEKTAVRDARPNDPPNLLWYGGSFTMTNPADRHRLAETTAIASTKPWCRCAT